MTLPLDHPAHFHHAPSFAALRAELVREAEARRRTYPGQIDKGRMTAQDAAWQHGVLAAIVQDLAAVIAVAVPALPPSPYSWADKRSALTRELDQRRRFYPGWIAKGRLDEGQAASQIAALVAMLALYNDGLRWLPAPGSTAEQRADQWRETMAALAQQSAPQQELVM